MEDVNPVAEIFRQLHLTGGERGLHRAPPKPKTKNTFVFVDPQMSREVLAMYVDGVDAESISQYVGLNPDEVNVIIDRYAAHL